MVLLNTHEKLFYSVLSHASRNQGKQLVLQSMSFKNFWLQDICIVSQKSLTELQIQHIRKSKENFQKNPRVAFCKCIYLD